MIWIAWIKMNHFQAFGLGHFATILSKLSLKITRAFLQKWTLAKSEIYIAILGNMLYTMCFIATEGSVFVQIQAVIGNLALVLICSSHTKILVYIE